MAKKKRQTRLKVRRSAPRRAQRTPTPELWPASELESLERKVVEAHVAAVWTRHHEGEYFDVLGGIRRYAIAWSMEQMAAALGGRPAAWVRSKSEHWVGSGNPLYVWAAYLDCRSQRMPIPEWVLAYLDRVAHGFHLRTRAGASLPRKPAAAIAEILEMKAPGRSGRGSVFSTYSKLNGLELAEAVRRKNPVEGKLYLAFDEVAQENGTSASTVERAWTKYKVRLDE